MTPSETCFIKETESEYRANARRLLSSHALADFRRCPLLYKRKMEGLIPDEERPAFLVGRAAHVRILEGELKYHREFAVGGPVNPKTNRPFGANTKAFQEWADKIGKPVLTDTQADLIAAMAKGFSTNPAAKALIYDGLPEAVVRAEYCGVACQSRLDFYSYEHGIVDLKTCDDLTWFEVDAKRYGYAFQMAFYRSMVRLVAGNTVPVHFIAIEKKEPYRCGVWRVSEQLLDSCQAQNEAAIERLKRFTETDIWPTGYEEVRVFDSY